MKTKAAAIVRFYFVVLAVALVLGNVDYELAKRTQRPWLSLPIAFLSDGGSRLSLGFGYTLMCRHKIDHREDDRTVYLVGPELKAWNVFQIFGARRLFERDYGDYVYYRDAERTEAVNRGSIAGDMIGQKLFMAVVDLFPVAALLVVFWIWTRIKKRIPTKASSTTK